MIGISDDISSEIDPSALTEDFGYALLRRQSVTIDKYVYIAPNSEDAANTEDGERKENKAETGESEFTDVSVSDFFYDAVMRAKKNGITDGITKDTFGANDSCTRTQMITSLRRVAGCPAPESTDTDFVDLDAKGYYYQAVLRGSEQGIVKGTSRTTFSPDQTMTRGQMATFLWRRAGSPTAKNKAVFTDAPGDSYYANAIAWAAEGGITKGMGGNTFLPNVDCTGGEIVTFLYRQQQ